MSSARIGAQEPTFERIGAYARTSGREVADTLEAYGFAFNAAQRHELDIYFARNEAGRPSATTVSLCKPRQNGKSYAARWYAFWCAAVMGKRVVYSAHNGDTVHEFFDMLGEILTDEDEYPDFAAMLSGKPYRQPGKERISFVGGGRIKFVTRTNSGSRGGTCDILVIDEAQELTEAQLNAMLPVISAGPSGAPQAIYLGTPPDPSCPGTVFARMHDRAHSDDPGNAWWVEWGVSELPPRDATKEDLLELAYETNPMLGILITEEAVLNEIETQSLGGFARERLAWWRESSTQAPPLLDVDGWRECLTDSPAMEGKTALGVKFTPDGSHCAVSACVVPPEGRPHIELIDFMGTSRGIEAIARLIGGMAGRLAMVAIDGRGGAAALSQRLRELGMPRQAVHECTTADAVSSTSMLVDAVKARGITHIDSPTMDDSATKSIRRDVGKNGAVAFGDGIGSSSAPIQSGALALWAVKTAKRDPSRKGRAA